MDLHILVQILGVSTGILFLGLCYLHYKYHILFKKHEVLHKSVTSMSALSYTAALSVGDLTNILTNKGTVTEEEITEYYKKQGITIPQKK